MHENMNMAVACFFVKEVHEGSWKMMAIPRNRNPGDPAAPSLSVRAACAALALAAGPAAAQAPLTFSVGEWAPFVGSDLEGRGLVAKIVAEAVRRMGYRAEFRFVPWARALEELREGKSWGSFPWKVVEERSPYSIPSKGVVFTSRSLYWHRTGNPKIPSGFAARGFEDLRGYRLGGVRGYFYEKVFSDLGIDHELAGDLDAAFRMLAAGRVDFIVENDLVGRAAVSRLALPAGNFSALSIPYSVEDMFALFSKAYPGSEGLRDRFDAALASMKADGAFDRIVSAYSGGGP